MDDQERLAAAMRLHQEGHLKSAEALYTSLIEKYPDVADLHINLGVLQRAQARPREAQRALEIALRLEPSHFGALFNLGNVHRDLGQYSQAIETYQACLKVAPDYADAALNLAETYSDIKAFSEAVSILQRALKSCPEDPRLHNNLGNVFKELEHLSEAALSISCACDLDPQNVVFKRNLASVRLAQGQPGETIKLMSDALKLAPEDAESHCLRAFAYLARSDFKKGWEDYQWRWRSTEQEAPRPFVFPKWQGQPLQNKSILLWGEQGVGDEIMFASMLGKLKAQAGCVVCECDPRLLPLFSRSFPDIEFVARTPAGDRRLRQSDFDYQSPLGDLALYLRTSRRDFGQGGAFLQAAPAMTERFRQGYKNRENGRKLCGLSWKSGASQTGNQRSLAPEDFAALASLKDVSFICLQYGDVAEDIKQFETLFGLGVFRDETVDQMSDMDRYAAQIGALDAVLTVANTTVHVSGGLGVPTQVLIPGPADWRWGICEATSPWYGSVHLHHRKETETIPVFVARAAEFV